MNEHNRKMSRRSALQAAGLGAGSSLLAAGLPRKSYAQAAGSVDQSIQWAKANLPNSTPEIVTAAAKEGNVTLLLQTSGTDQVLAAMIKQFNTHYPFINVSYTLQSTTEVLNRFSAELNAKRGVTDCAQLPSDLTQVNAYIAAGGIGQFVISQDAAFPEGAKQSGLWYAWAIDRAVTAYRKGALSDDETKLVRTFKGLGDPRFKGRIGMNGINNASTEAGAYVLLSQPDTSLWDGLVANKPQVKSSSPALMDGLLSGQYDISVFGSYASAATEAKSGAPIEFGTTALVPTVYIAGSVSALAPHPNSARLWQDWLMSKEGQDMWVSLVGVTSARSDVVESWSKQQPWFFEDPPTHKPLDWTDFAKKQNTVIAKFKKDFQAG